jgi:hypothetical protein
MPARHPQEIAQHLPHRIWDPLERSRRNDLSDTRVQIMRYRIFYQVKTDNTEPERGNNRDLHPYPGRVVDATIPYGMRDKARAISFQAHKCKCPIAGSYRRQEHVDRKNRQRQRDEKTIAPYPFQVISAH